LQQPQSLKPGKLNSFSFSHVCMLSYYFCRFLHII
jgi:hypothetical protein